MSYEYRHYPAAPPPRERHTLRNVLLGVVIVLAGIIAISVARSHGTSQPVASESSSSSSISSGQSSLSGTCDAQCQSIASQDNPPPASSAPVVSKPVSRPAAPAMTTSQQQAVDAAESYLQTEPGFSFQGLVEQLDSSYGSGFSQADAEFAVSHVVPATDSAFWDKQAAYAAQSYMQNEPGWSACGLLQQLDSAYGGQFTQSQAAYGVRSVGLGSC